MLTAMRAPRRILLGLVAFSLLSAPVSAQRLGEDAPDFRLVDRSGAPLALSDFHGTPVVLNFWATWCLPCLEELPLFQEIADALNAPGEAPRVAFLLLNANESPELAGRFLDEQGLRLHTALEPSAAQRQTHEGLGRSLHVLRDYRVRGMPTTVFIDAGGVVRGVKAGLIHRGEIAGLLAALGLDWQP